MKAFPDAIIFEAKPDRVSLVDIANLTGKTRQDKTKCQKTRQFFGAALNWRLMPKMGTDQIAGFPHYGLLKR